MLFLFILLFISNNDAVGQKINIGTRGDTLDVMCRVIDVVEYDPLFIIYAEQEDGSIYKIISKKEENMTEVDDCDTFLVIGECYSLRLRSMFAEKLLGLYYIIPRAGDGIRLAGVDIYIGQYPVLSDLYDCFNLKGRCYGE